MQNNNIDEILNKREFKKTNTQALNERIINLANNTEQEEFNSSVISVHNNVKILAITACFALGIFTGINLEASAISSEELDYIYIEEGIL